uniref:N-acetyllactosaminide beta-1,3-N-acetylglucosaminyltransferase n=1 Tax=Strongyloides stercoralis TaxID=6248 RepID=A0A0K0DWK3_STRER
MGFLFFIQFFIFFLLHNSKMALVKVRVAESSVHNNEYCVSYYYWKDSMNLTSKNPRITLVLHATIRYINYLADQINMWEGPISVALYFPTPEKVECIFHKHRYCAVYNSSDILYFQALTHFKHIYDTKKVSLHFFFKKNDFEQCPHIILKGIKVPNGNILKKYNKILSKINNLYKFFDIYPINAARNMARLGKRTTLFLSGDIENYPSLHYESKVAKLAKDLLLNNNRKLVLVHRRFEVNDSSTIPRTKTELKKLYENKEAFVFHYHFSSGAHKIPKLKIWFNNTENMHETKIAFINEKIPVHWEPQFVGNDEVPFHDEKFSYRKRSNTQLTHVMCYQGFDFAIMDDVFTVHQGIKRRLTTEEREARNLNYKEFKKMLKKFNSNLKKTYPEMIKRCRSLRQ